MNIVKKDYSEAINELKFPLTLFIILLHSITSASIPGDNYWKLIYPFLTIGEMGVPCFFFISGFLYFYDGTISIESYKRKSEKRINTLLVPYIIWNSLILLFYFLIQNIPAFETFFSGNNKSISDYNLADIVLSFWDKGDWNMGNGTPILQPMWYVRNLILLCLLSPVIYYVVKFFKSIGILLLGLWWITTSGQAFLSCSIFFFALGAYFSLNDINLFFKSKRYLYCFIFIYMATFVCDYLYHTFFGTNYGLEIHRVVLLLSIVFLLNMSVRGKKNVFGKYVQASFFVYAIHYPIILSLRKISVKVISCDNSIIQFLSMLLCVATCSVISLLIFYYIRRKCPLIMRILTGNRK